MPRVEPLCRALQADKRYMAVYSAQVEAQEAARLVQLARVTAIQAAQAKEAQVRGGRRRRANG